jgi:hypothetical protein
MEKKSSIRDKACVPPARWVFLRHPSCDCFFCDFANVSSYVVLAFGLGSGGSVAICWTRDQRIPLSIFCGGGSCVFSVALHRSLMEREFLRYLVISALFLFSFQVKLICKNYLDRGCSKLGVQLHVIKLVHYIMFLVDIQARLLD